MTIQQAVIVISTYMERFSQHMECAWLPEYATSLDALLAILDKLGLNVNLSYQPSTKTYRCRIWEYSSLDQNNGRPPKKYKSASEAVCMAAADAINRLEIKC